MEKRKTEDNNNTQTRDLLHDMDKVDHLSEGFRHMNKQDDTVSDGENNDEKEDPDS